MKKSYHCPFNGRLLLALISFLALIVACSTEDMVFEPSQEAIEKQNAKDVEPIEQLTPESTKESPVFIEPTPVIQTTPPGYDGAIDELNCATTREEINFTGEQIQGTDLKNSIYGPYLLNDARTGVHADYDRFVLEFKLT